MENDRLSNVNTLKALTCRIVGSPEVIHFDGMSVMSYIPHPDCSAPPGINAENTILRQTNYTRARTLVLANLGQCCLNTLPDEFRFRMFLNTI
jgi:hypothetical protein